ncbi:MAG: hypothetical protein HQK98_12285 [Nitrospirae bacterium]|nr:hypothetical protein [Nitrospirota bacterium]
MSKRKRASEIVHRLRTDYAYFASRCLFIQTTGGKRVRLRLNEIQQLLEGIIADIKANGRPVRLVILKARREGISTWAAGRLYWHCTTQSNRHAGLITHEPDATAAVFGMIRRMYDYHPEVVRPATRYNSTRKLDFNKPTGPGGLDSSIVVGTADKADFGSGQLFHYLHLSEVAKWSAGKARSVLTSVLQAVPKEADADTEVMLESTAKGLGGEFYDYYIMSRYKYEIYLDDGKPKFRCYVDDKADPDNQYSSVFIPFFAFDKYKDTTNTINASDLTNDERVLMQTYNLELGHISWRRKCIANDCKGDIDTFHQEYPGNDTEAFLTSGRAVFDNTKVMALMESAPEPTEGRYEIATSTGEAQPNARGLLQVWANPWPGHSYVIGADVAEGLEHGDYSAAVVVHHITGKQVAQWHGHCDPDIFAKVLYWLGIYYNTAHLVPERNNHGMAVVMALTKTLLYPTAKLWTETHIEPPNRPLPRYGWLTTTASKPALIDNLIMEFRENTHGLVSRDIFLEMLTYVQDEQGRFGAQQGRHDDLIMAAAIAKYTRTKITLPASAGKTYTAPVNSSEAHF